MVDPGNDDRAPLVMALDPANANVTMDTPAFIAKYPQLQVGIADMRMDDFPKRLIIQTKDGLKFVYNLETDTMSTEKEYNTAKQKTTEAAKDATSVFALGGENDRGMLYLLTGPRSKLEGQTFMGSTLNNPDPVKFLYDATSTPLTPDKAYLKAKIVYQDTDLAIILHQAQIGNDSDRLLTGVGADGKVLWSLGQAQLFPELALRADDPFSDMDFIEGKVSGVREGDLFIFRMEEAGIMAIDLKTGEKKWTFDGL